MIFVSYPFLLLFLPIVLLIAKQLRGRALWIWLTISSLWFYSRSGPLWFLAPFILALAANYFLAIAMERKSSTRTRGGLYVLSLVINLGLLALLKYAALIEQSLASVFASCHLQAPDLLLPFVHLLFPAGISFYVFRSIAYVTDVYYGQLQAERLFWKFASYFTFFPHLPAGPITRYQELSPELDRVAAEGIRSRWSEGVYLFSIGLCKKVLLADRLGDMTDLALIDPSTLRFGTALLAIFGYSLQIYFDFSAYSDMAIGVGRLFGMELPQNFDSPYQALNPADFWRRWHMTLSFWLRDYLFYPIYFGVEKWRGSRPYLFISLILTMFLGGLWHGASWTFAWWGCYQGVLLVLYQLTKNVWDARPIWLQRTVTFVLVSFGWILFRSNTFDMAWRWLRASFGWGGFHWSNLQPVLVAHGRSPAFNLNYSLLGLTVVGLILINGFKNASHFEGYQTMPPRWQVGLGVLVVVSMLYLNHSAKFLYYQF